MKTKVLSAIIIIVFFLTVLVLASSALPNAEEISGFWEGLAVFINIIIIASGTTLGGLITIKWFCK